MYNHVLDELIMLALPIRDYNLIALNKIYALFVVRVSQRSAFIFL